MECNFNLNSQERSHARDGFRTKFIRLEFPKFVGEDPLNLCYKAEQFFEHYSTPNFQRLKIASFHMKFAYNFFFFFFFFFFF
jgi:hypothetical protein